MLRARLLLQITSYWLPLLRRCVSEHNRRPVVLVGNKSDVIEVSKMQVKRIKNLFLVNFKVCLDITVALQLTMPILDEYEEAETCIEVRTRF